MTPVYKPRHSIYLAFYTGLHLLVDLSCIFYLMGMDYVRLPAAQTVTAAILYNLFAFALPMALGFLADIAGHNALVSGLGCILLLINYLFLPSVWASVVLLGIGNGLFHIGGGRQVLMDAGPRYAPSGIFIASGALGVYLGRTMARAWRQVFSVSLTVLLALGVGLLLYLGLKDFRRSRRSHPSSQSLSRGLLIFSLLIFLVVIMRSYYGFVAVYTWNHTFLTGLVFTLCIVAGKCTGGILADKVGVTAASVISLGGAGLLALFAADSPVLGCFMILLFNMTMPITLTLLAMLWHELPGFAFGTLMMALFLGTLPDMLLNIHWLSSPAGLMVLCLISLALLLAAIHGVKNMQGRAIDS